jgi:AcrR family transcriptional regulator
MTGTEERIEQAFRELLNEKPYSSITVKDIIERCGVNRNTFYYHFESIPYLFALIVRKDVDKLIHEHYDFVDPLGCLVPTVEYARDKKKSILHVYHSVERERFVGALQEACDYMAGQYIEKATNGRNVPEKDKKLMTRFYRAILVGILLNWLDTGMENDLVADMKRVWEILEDPENRAWHGLSARERKV